MTRSLFTLLALCTLIAVSCKKSSETNAAGELPIYFDIDSLFQTSSPYSAVAEVPGVFGLFTSCKGSGALVDSSGNTHAYKKNWQCAAFASIYTDSFTNAGNVVLNGTLLHRYVNYDTTGLWNEATSNHWSVSGSPDIPAFSADADGTFPEYSGTLPSIISRDTDISIKFNAANTTNADFAYVILFYSGCLLVTNVVNTQGGAVTIGKEYLSRALNDYLFWNIAPPGPHGFYGGCIDVVLYKQTFQTINGKRFAFVNQREYMDIVTFQ